MPMDWAGWAVFGLVATAALTGVMMSAQLAALTRLDIPLVLGLAVSPDPDRARVAGFFLHLLAGQVFAFGYAMAFAAVGYANWWFGALLGVVHAGVALGVIIPVLPGVHPRLASERAGPSSPPVLEPPGLFVLNYGARTPFVSVVAHVAYGAALGMLLKPG